MVDFVPVDHDPFASGQKLIPVDHDPFAAAAQRTRQSVKPEGGRQEGPATYVLENYLPHVTKGLTSLPGRFLEEAGSLQRGGSYDAGPALETSMLMAGARSPFVKPGEIGTFGGRGSQTADLRSLADAERTVTKYGVDPELARQATGWHQGVEGKWRYEIPDAEASINSKYAVESKNYKGEPETKIDIPFEGVKIAEFVDHPDLFAAYPELKNVTVKPVPLLDAMSGTLGGFNHDTMTMYLGRMKPDEALSVMLHEIQHFIQNRENFVRGSNVGKHVPKEINMPEIENLVLSAKKDMFEQLEKSGVLPQNDKRHLEKYAYLNAVKHLVEKGPELGSKYYKDRYGPLLEDLDKLGLLDRMKTAVEVEQNLNTLKTRAFDDYQRVGGEVEARLVQARRKLSREERRQTPPELKDFPHERQLIPVDYDPFR